jgi:hypothetical protein
MYDATPTSFAALLCIVLHAYYFHARDIPVCMCVRVCVRVCVSGIVTSIAFRIVTTFHPLPISAVCVCIVSSYALLIIPKTSASFHVSACQVDFQEKTEGEKLPNYSKKFTYAHEYMHACILSHTAFDQSLWTTCV